MTAPRLFTSPELIAQFNRAAELAREGELEASLEAWNALIDPAGQGERRGMRVLSGHFLGLAMMRRAWVLMDLERYEQARALFEDGVMQACLSQLEPGELHEWYFSYANTLGALKDVQGMDRAMTRALLIAMDELGDVRKCVLCWMLLIDHARRAEAWIYLVKEAKLALSFAQTVGEPFLEVEARVARRLALRKLGRHRQAAAEDVALDRLAARL